MSILNILRSLNRRNEDMARRRAERLARAEAELFPGYVDMTPQMWRSLHEGRGLTASTPDGPRTVPQAAERKLPPQVRYRTWASLDIGGRYGVHGMPFGDN